MKGPKPVLALLTHGDVQGVENQTWTSPPFAGKLVAGRFSDEDLAKLERAGRACPVRLSLGEQVAVKEAYERIKGS